MGMIGDQVSESPAAPFGSLLRSLRLAAGLTQEELADAAKLSYRSISDLERGLSRSPRRGTTSQLAAALGLSGDDRVGFEAAARGRVSAAGRAGPPPLPGGSAAGQAAPPLVIRYSLPPDATFTGRDEELRRIMPVAGQAGAGGVVAIHAIGGMPGAGKTALAVHAAHLLRDRFPDRQLFIDLHAHTPGQEPMTSQAALAGLLSAVGVDVRHLPEDLDVRAGLWRDRMAGQQALLVLDNAASSAQVAPLLPGSEGCLVLVTSRRHLADLPGAAVPLVLEALPSGQACEMFVRLAPRAADEPAEAVAELAQLAGCLPLAISLLARAYARHPSWTLAELTAETQARMLTLAAETDSVAAAFEVSYRYLAPGQQELFRLLGLHPGATIDAYAAAALAGSILPDAARQLDALHGEGLLTEVSYHRYRMHDLIRGYARDLAAAVPVADREQALDRLLDYYQHTAEIIETRLARRARTSPAPAAPPAAVPDLPDQARALTWARTERTSLLGCLDHATGTGQHARIVALTAALSAFLRIDGPFADAVVRHAAAVQAARYLGDRPGQANALTGLGMMRRVTGDYPGAAEALQEALSLSRGLGDRPGQANVLLHLGAVRWQTGNYPGAAQVLQEALSLSCDLNDRLGQANALSYLGAARRLSGDYTGAAGAQEEALELYTSLSDRGGQANALLNLGIVRRATGDCPGAAQALQDALRLYRNLGDRGGEAETLNETGTLHRVRGDYSAATISHHQALDLARELGSFWDEAHALAGLGRCSLAVGQAADAETTLQQALKIFRQAGAAEADGISAELDAFTQAGPASTASNVPQPLSPSGSTATHPADQEASTFADDLGYQNVSRGLRQNLGFADLIDGDPGSARRCFLDSLETDRITGVTAYVHGGLLGLALAAGADDDPAVAATLHGTADAHYERAGRPFEVPEAGLRDGDHARLRATLGDAAFEAAYTRGRTLSRSDAITLAIAAAGPGPAAASASVPLSEREREILALLAGGATDAQIAARLFLSVNTVRSHLERIRDKTGARRRPDLVRYAIQAGIQAIAPAT
jgi:DNA-binding CsgD family transcriptional regulator/tetratricopeptide (TPR) repeat protein/transcriptional regulator with XRE-family HTH domain